MNGRRFTLDTNILVYAMDATAAERQVTAAHIIDRARHADCLLTLQSISEFYAVVIRKRRVPVAGARDQALDWLAMFSTAAVSPATVQTALRLASAGRASYWDALLIATAAEAGCTAILTEDLGDAASLAGVTIINPFSGTALPPAVEALLRAD